MSDWQFRPARDQGLSTGERLRSVRRERGLGSTALALLWRGAVATYLQAIHRLEVTGRENLPEPPFVMIGNHCSHLDALVLATALPGRLAERAFALAAGDTFFTSTARATFAAYAINALPVWRSRTSAGDIAGLRARLHEDKAVLILFPEGTRSRTGIMAPFKPGIATLIGESGVPVVPCHLRGAFEAWPAGRRLPRPGRLHLTIGTPLTFTEVAKGRAGLNAVSARCEAAVRALATGAG